MAHWQRTSTAFHCQTCLAKVKSDCCLGTSITGHTLKSSFGLCFKPLISKNRFSLSFGYRQRKVSGKIFLPCVRQGCVCLKIVRPSIASNCLEYSVCENPLIAYGCLLLYLFDFFDHSFKFWVFEYFNFGLYYDLLSYYFFTGRACQFP